MCLDASRLGTWGGGRTMHVLANCVGGGLGCDDPGGVTSADAVGRTLEVMSLSEA